MFHPHPSPLPSRERGKINRAGTLSGLEAKRESVTNVPDGYIALLIITRFEYNIGCLPA